jgi:hypothetical protein
VKCINDKTFKHSDIIQRAIVGNSNVTNDLFWAEEMTTFNAGKSYSLNNTAAQEEDDFNLNIFLKSGQNYSVYIHDPKYYLWTTNPEAIPHILLNMYDSKSQIVSIKAIYQQKMDKPKQQCEPSESYSFTACVKNSISKKIGCRLEWDSWSSKDIPDCTTVDQILHFEKEYQEFYHFQEDVILKYTGCLPPCSYTEYKLSAEPLKYQFDYKLSTDPVKRQWKGTNLSVKFSSKKALERTEELLYPWESFVSEFGGALGLFLGFSFMMIWDVLSLLFQRCLKSKLKL